jgi:PIN domain
VLAALRDPQRRGDELPAELARRETRLAAITAAKAALETEAAQAAREEAERSVVMMTTPPPAKGRPRPKPPRRNPRRNATSPTPIPSLELPAEAAHRLGEVRATTGLKLPDCWVLYTAERHNAAIATFDDTLATGAKNIGLTVAATPR